MQSNLTRSRKPRRRPFRLDVDLLDGLIDCCQSITTLAGLLQACDCDPDSQPLESKLVHNTGHLLLREAEQLQALLDELAKAA